MTEQFTPPLDILVQRDSLLLGLLVTTIRCSGHLWDSRFLDQVVERRPPEVGYGLFMFDGMNGIEPLMAYWMCALSSKQSGEGKRIKKHS